MMLLVGLIWVFLAVGMFIVLFWFCGPWWRDRDDD